MMNKMTKKEREIILVGAREDLAHLQSVIDETEKSMEEFLCKGLYTHYYLSYKVLNDLHIKRMGLLEFMDKF